MINVNQQTLLELLKASLFGTEPLFPDNADWDAVLQEAKDQTVVALAAPSVPVREAAKWQVPATQNKMRFFQILDEQTKLVQYFNDAKIPMVILKGCAAAMNYPTPMQRAMGDIDFIVLPERIDDAVRLMNEKEYVFTLKTPRHYDYVKNKTMLELHYQYSEKNWDIEQHISEGLSLAVTHEIYGNRFPTLPTEINGLVLIDHIRSHLYNGLGIRQIIDWMMFVHDYLDDRTWKNCFEPLVNEAGLKVLTTTVTKMCKLWFGLPDNITWCDDADNEVACQLMEMVFRFGNFGRKAIDEDRPMKGLIMESSKHGVFNYLQMTGEGTWHAYHKYPILRPFAWLYQCFRFAKKGFVALFRGEKVKLKTSEAIKNRTLLEKLEIVYSQNKRE